MRGQYVIIEEEAREVRAAFEAYLSEGSLERVAALLTLRGAKPRNGGTEWRDTVVLQMLHNRTYIGEAEFGRERNSNGVGVRGTGIPIPCPPIVDRVLFDAVQACIGVPCNRRMTEKPQNRINLLRRMIVCGDCGADMEDGFYRPNKVRGWGGGGFYACKSCKPTWNEVTPRPQWSTYGARMIEPLAREELSRLMPEEDRDLVIECLFSPNWDMPTWQRRNLLLLGRTVVKVFNHPFRVEVTLGGPTPSPEVLGYMSRFFAKQVRQAVNQHNYNWMMELGRSRKPGGNWVNAREE
jgi:hypothetical protein